MALRHWIMAGFIGGAIAAFLGVYIGLIHDGSVPPPDPSVIPRAMGIATTTAASLILIIGVGVLGFLALLAPVIYAARAHDLLTVLISLALTGSAIALFAASHTVFDQISALILYLANVTLSAAVYIAHRIAPHAP